MTIWGTDEVAAEVLVDQDAMFRVAQPVFLEAIRAIDSVATPPAGTDQQKFDAKFDYLKQRLGIPDDVVEPLREEFRAAWAQSISLNDRLSSTIPDMHRQFEKLRKQAATDARIEANKQGADAFTVLEKTQTGLRLKIEAIGAGMPLGDQDTLARAETGRLLGDCLLDWRKP